MAEDSASPCAQQATRFKMIASTGTVLVKHIVFCWQSSVLGTSYVLPFRALGRSRTHFVTSCVRMGRWSRQAFERKVGLTQPAQQRKSKLNFVLHVISFPLNIQQFQNPVEKNWWYVCFQMLPDSDNVAPVDEARFAAILIPVFSQRPSDAKKQRALFECRTLALSAPTCCR